MVRTSNTQPPLKVLSGLRPGLAIELAGLTGETAEDLLVTLQVMRYGDRITLAAYGAIEQEWDSDRKSKRVSKINPLLLELIVTASHVAAKFARSRELEFSIVLDIEAGFKR